MVVVVSGDHVGVRTGYRNSCHEGNDDTSRAEVVDNDDAEPKLTPSFILFALI